MAPVGNSYVWAVGHEGNVTPCCTLTARWNGTSWSRVTSVDREEASNFLKAVAVGPDLGCGSHDTWAAGHSFSIANQAKTLILRYTTPAGCSP